MKVDKLCIQDSFQIHHHCHVCENPMLHGFEQSEQSRNLRKSNHLKYSASAFEGLSGKLQVKRSCSHNISVEEAETTPSGEYSKTSGLGNNVQQSQDIALVRKKAKIDEIITKAENLLECRFQRSRTSPIGVGISASDCQTQYFNLLPNWFQSESSLITSKIPTLLGSGHPVLRLRKNLDPDAEEHLLTLLSNNIQWRAFIILLVAKAFGTPNNDILHKNRSYLDSIEARQRTLAEIAEMMHFAFCLHRTIVEIDRSKYDGAAMEEKESSLHLGNKIVVLFSDLLLSRTSKGLSSLKNAKVTELMSDAISDFSESEILRRKHVDYFKPVLHGNADVFKELAEIKENKCLEVPTFESWKSRVNLDIASLIGRACKSSILISQHDEGASELAHDVGRLIGLVIQAYVDLEVFMRDKSLQKPELDLSSLPVIFHLNSDSVERIYNPTDISHFYRSVLSSPIALLRTQNALDRLKQEALHLISKLPRSTPAPQILENFIVSLS